MFFDHDSHRIHYTDDGHGEPLLFLHGLGGNLLNWTYQRQHFAARRRVICLDLPGHGRSEGKLLPFAEFPGVVEGLLDTLGIERSAICGLSKGARVGLGLAARSPRRVSALVMVNAFLRLEPSEKADRIALYDRLEGGRAGAVAWANELLGRMGVVEGGRIHRGFMRSLDDLDGAHVRALFRQIVELDQRGDAAAIACPTLLIRGANDGFVPAGCHEELRTLVAHAEAEILADVGHLPYLESPDVFNRTVEDFLRRRVR